MAMLSFYRCGAQRVTYPEPDSKQSVGKPVCLYSQARALFTRAAIRFGELGGPWGKVLHKSKRSTWPLSKSSPFGEVLALIQPDNCCSSCSSICATANQTEERFGDPE